MSWLLIGTIVFLIIMMIVGWVKGFSQSLLSLVCIVLSIFLAWVATPHLEKIVAEKTDWEQGLATTISEKFFAEAETEEELMTTIRKWPLPANIKQNCEALAINAGENVADQKAAVSGMFANWIVTLLIDLILFFILTIILSLIGRLITKAIKHSPLRVVDGALGAVLSAAEGVLIVDAVLLLISALATTSIGKVLMEQVTKSRIMQWVFDHNVISMLASTFLHINL